MDAKRAILRYSIMEFQKMKDKFLQVPRERKKIGHPCKGMRIRLASHFPSATMNV